MFDVFDQSARDVVTRAQLQARTMGNAHIGTEHVLLAVLEDTDALGSRILKTFGVEYDEAQDDLSKVLRAERDVPKHIPFTPNAKESFDAAVDQRLAMDHDLVGTDHIVLGILCQKRGMGAAYLDLRKVELDAFRSSLLIAHVRGQTDPRPERMKDPA